MSGLEVRNLVKKREGRAVVDDVSFHIPHEEFFVLLGPSGGGKTTILRLICGLEQPDAGQILIDGRDVTTLPSRDRHLSMVFQEYGLYPNMDVFQNIAYGLETRGVPRQEVRQRVTESATALGLADLLQRSINDLSGGEQQRVALARAMAKEASCYLFDEPLSNLDPTLRTRARRQIKALHRQKAKASLYVTHDQAEALASADRLGIMAHGNLQQVGTPEDLLHEPANLFVARFLGVPPMNLVPGELRRDGDAYRVVNEGVAVTLPGDWDAALGQYGKDQIIVGVRPDAFSANGGAEAPGTESTFEGEVTQVEPLIGETAVTLRLAGGTRVAAMFGDLDEDDVSPGGRLRAVIDADRVRLFDPDTERAIERRDGLAA
jgi:multiple sugar transport system ATP-binding protein